MNKKPYQLRANLIFLIASAIFVVGCADKRGFQAKRILTPLVADKPETQGDDGQTPPIMDDQSPAVLAPSEQILDGEELTKNIDQTVDSNTKVSDTQIVYQEGGNETPVTPEQLEEIKTDLEEIILATTNLPADQQLLKGLSITRTDGATATALPVEVMGLIEIDGKSEPFVAAVILNKGQNEKSFAGTTSAVNWTNGRTDINSEIMASCSGVDQDPCSMISVMLQISQGESVQAFAVLFLQGENGYAIYKRSAPIVSFLEAQNGTAPAVEEPVAEETEQTETEQATEDTPAQEEVPEEQTEAPAVETPEAQPPAQQQQQEVVEEETAKEDTVIQEPAQQPAARPKAQSGPSHRQAEEESMAKLRAMQADQKAQAEQQKPAPQPKASSGPSHRQAENESMKKLNKYKAPTHRQAETASMNKLRVMQAEQKRKADMEKFRQADKQSMENLRKSQAPTHRQAEIASMEKLNQMQAEQKRKATKSFREAEEESMESLRYMQKIDKLLKDNEHADFEDI